MTLDDLNDWLALVSGPEYVWYVKRLAANDTLATESHQVGVYLPKPVAFSVFPDISSAELLNPDHIFTARIDSHNDEKGVRAIWYNNKYHGDGTRDECRITRWGGISSPIQNPESTGSLVVFAFQVTSGQSPSESRLWVCNSVAEEELVEAETGVVEPGGGFLHYPAIAFSNPPVSLAVGKPVNKECRIAVNDIPSSWVSQFPTGAEILEKVFELVRVTDKDADTRLVKRRECEYQLFSRIEEAYFGPRIKQGFNSVQSFVDLAQSILQSRKSRSGKSLELNMKALLVEEGLKEDRDFSWNKTSENNKRPDFIFPSVASYKDKSYPDGLLHMLAVKTTCKDRWRQILNEADRIGTKHLLTLQEGVSENQFGEMSDAGVVLVVPESLRKKYPKVIRSGLLSVSQFISKVRSISARCRGRPDLGKGRNNRVEKKSSIYE